MKSRDAQFEALVDNYYTALHRFALMQCKRPNLFEDPVQEIFARTWCSLSKLKELKATRAWLLTLLWREHARLYEYQRPETRPPADLPTVAVYVRRLEPDAPVLVQALDPCIEEVIAR